MNIRPISDLRNHYSEVEQEVLESGPIFLTKNGYGSMVVMSMEQFEHINGSVESALDAADRQAATTTLRYSHDEVFGSIREGLRHGDAPKQYRLRYLPLFWDDLNDAVTYIADVLKAPLAAEHLLDEVEAGILSYLDHPTIAPIYKTTRQRPLPYYWFDVGNYMVFYVVIDDVMEVRRFVYGARDLTRMLP